MSQGYPPQYPGGPRPQGWGADGRFGESNPPMAATTPYGQPGRPQPPGFQPPGMAPVPSAPPPDNYLAWAVLATVFCCFPAGIPALVAATSVNERWLRGDIAGARDASLQARNWTICAVLLGVIFWTTWMVGVFVLGWKDTLGDL